MKKFFRAILFTTCLLSMHHALCSQVTVFGEIKDQSKTSLLSGANVMLISTETGKTFGMVSNEHGQFQIQNVPRGQYSLTSTFVGYEKYDTVISVEAEKASIYLGTLYLISSITVLDEVTVEELRSRVDMKGDTTEFESETYKTMPNSNIEEQVRKP